MKIPSESRAIFFVVLARDVPKIFSMFAHKRMLGSRSWQHKLLASYLVDIPVVDSW